MGTSELRADLINLPAVVVTGAIQWLVARDRKAAAASAEVGEYPGSGVSDASLGDDNSGGVGGIGETKIIPSKITPVSE